MRVFVLDDSDIWKGRMGFFFLRIGACSGLDVGENEIDESKE